MIRRPPKSPLIDPRVPYTTLIRSKLAVLDPASLPLGEREVRYGPCVAGTRHFVAIGLNYADHAAESNLPIPEEPVVFNKWVSCIHGPNDPVTIPKDSQKTDWEVELGVVIGTRASYVSEADARSEEHTSELQSLMRISYAVF